MDIFYSTSTCSLLRILGIVQSPSERTKWMGLDKVERGKRCAYVMRPSTKKFSLKVYEVFTSRQRSLLTGEQSTTNVLQLCIAITPDNTSNRPSCNNGQAAPAKEIGAPGTHASQSLTLFFPLESL